MPKIHWYAVLISIEFAALAYALSYAYHAKDPPRVSSGLAELYIGNHGMEVAGSGAVIIAKSGSTVILYKDAQLTEGDLDRLSIEADFARNFDDHFAMTYGADGAIPTVWDSRTIAQAGSLILAGGNARVLAEDGAKIIHKNVEAPKWLWNSQDDTRTLYARAQNEAG